MNWKVYYELLTPEGETETFTKVYWGTEFKDVLKDLKTTFYDIVPVLVNISNYDQ